MYIWMRDVFGTPNYCYYRVFTDSSLEKRNESALIDFRNVEDRAPVVRNAVKTKNKQSLRSALFSKRVD